MRLLVLLALLPLGAAAQDAAPAFDASIVTGCVAESDPDARPESCIGRAANSCMEQPGGSTTVGMSSCLSQETAVWDGMLNEAYQTLMTSAEEADAEMAQLGSAAEPQAPALREMQRRWIAYRDAACTYERTRWGGGSGAGPASAGCAMNLTARQALWLRDYSVEGR